MNHNPLFPKKCQNKYDDDPEHYNLPIQFENH